MLSLPLSAAARLDALNPEWAQWRDVHADAAPSVVTLVAVLPPANATLCFYDDSSRTVVPTALRANWGAVTLLQPPVASQAPTTACGTAVDVDDVSRQLACAWCSTLSAVLDVPKWAAGTMPPVCSCGADVGNASTDRYPPAHVVGTRGM